MTGTEICDKKKLVKDGEDKERDNKRNNTRKIEEKQSDFAWQLKFQIAKREEKKYKSREMRQNHRKRKGSVN